MKIPPYFLLMPWFKSLSPDGQLLFLDVLRLLHIQYHGMDINYGQPYGIYVTHEHISVGLSPGRFRKARKELLFNGILNRIERGDKEKAYRRDAFMFRIPS